MNLKVLLPFGIFIDCDDVTSLVVETRQGSCGFLPHRRDCVAALAPGILTYVSASAGEVFVAVDQGVVVKAGTDVLVSVRRAHGGAGLAGLRDAVERDFLSLDASETHTRAAMDKMASDLVRRMVDFHNDR
jgi:F-type H+-transporting ATPase subunit epsilon